MGGTLYLCGAGNAEGVRLAKRVNEAEERWERIVLLDDDDAKRGKDVLGVRVEGPFELLGNADPSVDEVQNLVARTTAGRELARARIRHYDIPFATLIDPGVDREGATLDRDLIVYHNATLGPESSVSDSSVVFMGAVVGHESQVGHGCIIASNAVLNARVVLEDFVYVGTNATILPEVTIGAGATIGAGSVVIQDIPPGATAFGVPAHSAGAASLNDGVEADGFTTNERGEATHAVREVETVIARIWEDEIGSQRIGMQDNFFDVGGSSLLALRVIDRMNDALGANVSIADFFQCPTVRLLATRIQGRSSIPPAVREGEFRAAVRRFQFSRRPS